MEFFNQAIDILKILVMALGAGLAVWASSTFWKVTGRTTLRQKQGIKQLMAGGGVVSDRPSAYPSAVRAVQLNVTRCPFFQKRS